MPSQEEIYNQLDRLQANRRRLSTLLLQEATHGRAYVPPGIISDIYESRAEIQRIKAILLGWGAAVEDHPDDGDVSTFSTVPPSSDERIPLSAAWQHAADIQRNAKKDQVVPEITNFVVELCKALDFVVVPESYYIHHNLLIACRVKAPTLNLNLPAEFLLILMIEEDASDELISRLPVVLGMDEDDSAVDRNDLINQLPDIPIMMDVSMNFGLVLVRGSHRQAQLMVNRLVRPAMKNDLIVLGQAFLNDIARSPSPQTVLLRAILNEIDLTRVSPFMAGGADLTDRMFFGREGELKNIAQGIGQTSVAITCGRRIGKTTLLSRLARVVLPARGYPCFFLNCQPIHDYKEFLAQMTTAWKRSDLPFDPANPNSFADVAAALTGPTGIPPVFLFDEADQILQYDEQHQQRLFKQLRALSLEGRARFIMTGERSVQAHIHDANSPLFNFFGLSVKLSFLDIASTNRLVSEPLNDMQIELAEPAKILAMIFNATSGHPYLVQRLCQGLIQAISRSGIRAINAAHVENVLNESEYQQAYFETVWGQAQPLAKLITMLVGSQGATMKEIRELLATYHIAPSLREISDALFVLDLYSVMVSKAGRYRFVASAFPEMVHRAYGEDLETNIELHCEEYYGTSKQ